jgi:hypothetical protein
VQHHGVGAHFGCGTGKWQKNGHQCDKYITHVCFHDMQRY